MKELSLNILDIVQNSIRAEADEISVGINESEANDIYRIIITDNGMGIHGDLIKNVTDPFVTTRTRRKMGLGLSLLKYHAELAGGGLKINSKPGSGTTVEATLSYKHFDRQPLGDIAGVMKIMIAGNDRINFKYHHRTDLGDYCFSTKETKEYLGIDTLSDRILLEDITHLINENLREIKASGIVYNKRS
jgi:hypothetical protein